MSTEQEDVALLLELQEKITRRIREQILAAFDGYEQAPGANTPIDLSASGMRDRMKWSLLNDHQFVTELTKRVGQKMQNALY